LSRRFAPHKDTYFFPSPAPRLSDTPALFCVLCGFIQIAERNSAMPRNDIS
jgi:hypothetical protein